MVDGGMGRQGDKGETNYDCMGGLSGRIGGEVVGGIGLHVVGWGEAVVFLLWGSFWIAPLWECRRAKL